MKESVKEMRRNSELVREKKTQESGILEAKDRQFLKRKEKLTMLNATDRSSQVRTEEGSLSDLAVWKSLETLAKAVLVKQSK